VIEVKERTVKAMKTIVCFGDSNTWGADPLQGPRFNKLQRWPGILRNILGDQYWIIEEGLCGRTTISEDPVESYKCGKDYLIPCLQSHTPVDLVIIMLGTNDLKKRFSLSVGEIAKGVGVLAELVQKINYPFGYTAPQILLIAPPPILEAGQFKEMFAGGAEKSLQFGAYYAEVATNLGCHFLDAGKIVRSSPVDGIHFDAREHAKLGTAVAEKVMEIFGVYF
jgi:lysophospholipase L1-like esterase